MMPLRFGWSASARRLVTFLSLAVVLALVGAACGSSSAKQAAPRPSTTAKVEIVSPTAGQIVTGTTLHVVLKLTGGSIFPPSTEKPLRPDLDHLLPLVNS